MMPGRTRDTTSEIVATLRENLESLRRATKGEGLSARHRSILNQDIQKIGLEIEALLREIDPVKLPPAMFDPGNPDLVGRFISLALVAQPSIPLSEIVDFYGAGVYAIYYHGGFDAYLPISGKEAPIYVGKADPAVATARTPIEQKTKLSGRLKEHRKSIIRASTTLSTEDFDCRYLVVQSGWEKSAETFLIDFFKPVWNNETDICYGLGKHGDAAETRVNRRSPWDTLHPGRKWAEKTTQDAMPESVIRTKLAEHFTAMEAQGKLFTHLMDVLNAFIQGLRFSGDQEIKRERTR